MEKIKKTSGKTIKVAVSNFAPLVIKSKKKWAGFEIELWELIAKEMRIDFEYVPCTFGQIFSFLKSRKADVGMAGITINEEREKIVDFSHYVLETGLLILVRNNDKFSLWESLKSFLKDGYKKILIGLAVLALFVVFSGNLLWFVEKGSGVFTDSYIPGILEAFWFVVVTISTVGYGDYVPHMLLGRIIGAMVIFLGYIFFGLFIAEMSSFFSLKKSNSSILDYRDLVGKTVGTVKKTTSVEFLRRCGAKVVAVAKIEHAYRKLEKKELDAVVFDAPVLLSFLKKGGNENFQIVGEIFEPQSYGIAMRNRSKLREKINRALLKIKEEGYYDLLYKKWFGDNEKME